MLENKHLKFQPNIKKKDKKSDKENKENKKYDPNYGRLNKHSIEKFLHRQFLARDKRMNDSKY